VKEKKVSDYCPKKIDANEERANSMEQKNVELTPLVRAAEIQPDSLNEDKRTVDVVFSTGASVVRQSFFGGRWEEELSLKKEHVRLQRLNNHAPVLNNHQSEDLRNQIGVVVEASVDGKQGRATLRFSKRNEVEPIFQDIRDGILRNISVGYKVHQFEKRVEKREIQKGQTEDIEIYRAIDWEPIELSVVPAGADDGAKIRSEKADNYFCQVLTRQEEQTEVVAEEQVEIESRSEEQVEQETRNEPIEQPSETVQTQKGERTMDENTIKQDAVLQEKARQKEIRSLVRSMKLDDKIGEELIEKDISVDEARKEVIEILAKKQVETDTRSAKIEVSGQDEHVTRKEAMTEAILFRHDSNKFQLTEKSRQFAYASLLDLAKVALNARGIKTAGMRPSEIAERALHSTSDFPEILANVAGKTLRAGYEAAPQTFAPFTRRVQVPDFKQVSRTQLGDAPDLELVPESGEIKRGTVGEAAEKYQVATYGKIVGVTRQTLVNDDLSAFTRLPEMMGRAARDLESDLVWGIFNSNPLMGDGVALFHATHGNLGTAGAPSETTLSEARKGMRSQVGLGGRLLNIIPMWIISGTGHETAIEKLLATVIPDVSTSVSPFSRTGRTPLQQIVEPRLDAAFGGSDTQYFFAADLGQLDMIELANLVGESGPSISSRQGFDVEGVEMKVVYDIGVKAIDYRGLYKNAGV